jgi:hypothetical protein
MTIFLCINKETGVEDYRYDAVAVDPNLRFFGFDTHDHVAQPEPVTPVIPESSEVPKWLNLIDIGPFMDRFGDAKLAILKAKKTNDDVAAVYEDMTARKYIDIAGEPAKRGVATLQALLPEVTAQVAYNVLKPPVQLSENFALRTTYFNGEGGHG